MANAVSSNANDAFLSGVFFIMASVLDNIFEETLNMTKFLGLKLGDYKCGLSRKCIANHQ